MVNAVKIMIEAEDKASKTIDGVNDSIGDLGKQSKSVGDQLTNFAERNKATFQTMAVAGTAAFGAIAFAANNFIQSANEQIRVNTQLDAVLTSTGNAVGLTAQEIQNMASVLQLQTGIADDAIQTGQNLLLTFTNIGKDSFPIATQAMLDMATAMNGGIRPSAEQLKGTAIQLGKALNDPVNGANALRRVGVSLTEQQQEQIKTLVAQNKLFEAQKIILDELGKEFGGSALAQAKTFEGQMAILNAQLADAGEAIGMALLPMLQQLMAAVTPVINSIVTWVNENPKLAANIMLVAGAVAGIVAVAGTLGLLIPTIVAGFTTLATVIGFLLSPVGLVVTAIVGLAYIVVSNWDVIKEAVSSAIDFIWGKIEPFVTWVTEAWTAMTQAISMAREAAWVWINDTFGVYAEYLSAIFAAFKALFSGDFQGFIDNIRLAWELGLNMMRTFFANIGVGIVNIATALWNNIKGMFKAGVDWIRDLFIGAKDAVVNAFNFMLDGLVGIAKSIFNGIVSVIEGFINKAINAFNKLIKAANNIGGISIPLIPELQLGRLAHGGIAGEGFFGGVTMGMQHFATGGVVKGPMGNDAVPAMLTAGEVVLNAAQQRTLAGQLGGQGQVINITISNNEFYGSDDDFADKIGDTILQKFKLMASFESF